MIVDFHTHIFPDFIRSDRQRYFPGEPAFALLYGSEKAKLIGVDHLISNMDDQGIDRSVVFGFPWKNLELARRQNDYIQEAVGRYSGRLYGFCCVDPSDAQAAGEVERCLNEEFSGVGELAFYEGGIDSAAVRNLMPIMEAAREKKVPVMIHTNEPVGHLYPGKTVNTLAQIYSLIQTFPENKIVLAHWGGGIFFYSLLKKKVRDVLQNVYVDTAASPFLYEPSIYRYAVDLMGVDKILFGSDYPLIDPQRYFKEIERCGLNREEVESIGGKNAETLLR